MRGLRYIQLLVAATAVSASMWAGAITTAGSGSVLVIPIVAQTGTFSSEISVQNPSSTTPLTVNVRYYDANGLASPGLKPCNQLNVPASATVAFQLASQCTLGAGSHFGLLVLEDAAAQKYNTFRAYSRTQNFAASGFSVEGFPIGNFSGDAVGTNGLKRTAAAPSFQSNCFVAALGEAVDYRIRLTESTASTQIGNDITGSLQPWEVVRYLDVFTAAGLPSGDYQLVRALADNTNPGQPAFVAFCTVQDNVSFGADFRIMKTASALDESQFRFVCFAQSPCGTLSGAPQITDITRKLIHWIAIRQPDYVKCVIISPRLSDLEIRLRGPGDTFTSPLWPSSPPYSSGGNDQTSFYIYTGPRNAIANGTTTRWYIDVSFREGAGNTSVPIDYGMQCWSGNGINVPWVRASDVDDF